MLHSASADVSVLLVGLHFALNWDWVAGMLRRYVIAPLAGLARPNRAAQPVPVSNDDQL
jgi:hypothetical protein